MSTALDYAAGFGAILRRDWAIFKSYRTQLLTIIVSTLLTLTLFYYVSRLVGSSNFGSPDAYFAYVLVGMVILQVLQSTISVSNSVRAEVGGGTFERMVLSPFGAVPGIISMMMFPFVSSLVVALVMLVLGSLVFGVDIRWETAALGLPLALLGTGSFAGFGMLFAASSLLFKRAVSGLGFVMTLIALVSGLYFPISLLPDWIEWTSDVQPFTPAVDLLRNVLVGTPLRHPAWQEVLKLVGFLVIAIPVALLAVRGAVRLGQRRGTIIEV